MIALKDSSYSAPVDLVEWVWRFHIRSLKLTFSPMKMDGWSRWSFPFGTISAYFSGATICPVSFRGRVFYRWFPTTKPSAPFSKDRSGGDPDIPEKKNGVANPEICDGFLSHFWSKFWSSIPTVWICLPINAERSPQHLEPLDQRWDLQRRELCIPDGGFICGRHSAGTSQEIRSMVRLAIIATPL